MAGQIYMCDFCKLDKLGICNYECIKRRSDCMFRFFICPNFIYNDKTPMTNAELLSTDLKTDLDGAATQLWYKLVMDWEMGIGFDTFEDFVKWLKKEAVIN